MNLSTKKAASPDSASARSSAPVPAPAGPPSSARQDSRIAPTWTTSISSQPNRQIRLVKPNRRCRKLIVRVRLITGVLVLGSRWCLASNGKRLSILTINRARRAVNSVDETRQAAANRSAVPANSHSCKTRTSRIWGFPATDFGRPSRHPLQARPGRPCNVSQGTDARSQAGIGIDEPTIRLQPATSCPLCRSSPVRPAYRGASSRLRDG